MILKLNHESSFLLFPFYFPPKRDGPVQAGPSAGGKRAVAGPVGQGVMVKVMVTVVSLPAGKVQFLIFSRAQRSAWP